MAEPATMASPSLTAPTPTLSNPNPSPDVPSPVLSDVQPAASSTPPATAALGQSQNPQTVNGVALAAAATAVAAAHSDNSPAPRSDAPRSHSHPSTPTVVNGQVPQVPAPPPVPGTGSSLSASSTNPPPGAAARAKEQLRWRDPMTVKYDGGQAQPGKLQPSVSSPQLKQIQPYQQQSQQQSQSQPQSQHLQQPQQHSTPPPQQAQAPQAPQVPQHAPPQSQPQPLPHVHQQQQQQQHLHSQGHSQHPQHPHPQQQQTQQPQQQQHHHQQQQQQHQSHTSHSAHQPLQQYIHPQQQQQSHPYPHPHPHLHPQQQQPPPQPTLPPLHHRPQIQSQSLQPPPPTRPPATQNISKPVIMDPPGSRRAAAPHPAGFPSPTIDHANVNGKFVDDCTRITFAVQQSLPESVRRIVRDNWEKCLLGSEFHQAFILNASIHHALPSITRRAVRDFGEKMVRESKSELIGHFTTADFDEVADLIISKASDSFFDKCLAKRLRTIEAKPLINALAKAERLGYEPGDIVEADQHERVIPQEAYPGAAAAAANGFAQARSAQVPQQPPPQAQPQPQMSYPPHQQLQCMSCYRTFTGLPAYDYHTRNNVCSQTPPTTTKGFEHSCPYCGQGFTRLDELQGHNESRICATVTPKVSRGPGRPARSAPLSQANPVAILPSMSQSPGPNGYPPSYTQTQAAPTHHSSAPRPSMGTPASTASPNPSDPYAHLSPEALNQMNEELQGAEMKYAPRFAEAEAIQDENERRARIEGLRNSFGTKQSMIRKKYGVRLRERRTKAEIAAERERMGLKRAEREKAKIALANQQHNSSSPAPAGTAAPGTASPGTVAMAAGASGWTAANTPRTQNIWDDRDAKRRRIDGAGGYQTPYKSLGDETPTRKTLSVTELGGGLTGSLATVAAQDPTLPPQSAQLAHEEQQQPAAMKPKAENKSASPTPSGNHIGQARSTSDDASRRTSLEAATAPPPQNNQPPAAMDIDSDSSDDDQDIPSVLPPNVRSSLTSSQPQLHGLST